MKTLPLSNDGVTETKFHVNDDEFVIQTIQDVQPILDLNKANQNDTHNPKAIGRHAARIPHVVMREWVREFKRRYGISFHQAPKEVTEKFIYAKLDDRDYSHLRTWKGQLSNGRIA